MNSGYLVALDSFHGPLDLLLYLVKKNEVDILDIPISAITTQYLEYLRMMTDLDVEFAGEFIVLASTLMEIKSRMMLPDDSPETSEDQEDPRRELVRQLLEYRKFKEAASTLESRAEHQQTRMTRETPPDPQQQPDVIPLRSIELWDLVSAFNRLMRETQSLQVRHIVVDETPQHIYEDMILSRLAEEERISFRSLFAEPFERSRLIGIFLAVLELIKKRLIDLEQLTPFEEIWLLRPSLGEPQQVEG